MWSQSCSKDRHRRQTQTQNHSNIYTVQGRLKPSCVLWVVRTLVRVSGSCRGDSRTLQIPIATFIKQLLYGRDYFSDFFLKVNSKPNMALKLGTLRSRVSCSTTDWASQVPHQTLFQMCINTFSPLNIPYCYYNTFCTHRGPVCLNNVIIERWVSVAGSKLGRIFGQRKSSKEVTLMWKFTVRYPQWLKCVWGQ